MLGHSTKRLTLLRAKTQRFFRKRIWLVVLIALAVIAGGASASFWVYGKVKNRQSHRLVDSGMQYLRDNKPDEAKMAFETALRLNPSNSSALRMLARVQQGTGLGDASLLTWQKLAESGSMNLEDLSSYALLAAARKDWALAMRLADAVARGGNPTLRHLLRAELFSSEGKTAEAEEELRLAAEVDETGNGKSLLADFLIRNRLNAETAPEIRDLLRELSARPDGAGARALSSAISTGLVPANELPGWIAALRAHPEKTPRMLLLADAAELAARPDDRDRILSSLASRVEAADIGDRIAAIQWLTSLGAHRQAIDLLTADEAASDAMALSLWMDAHAALGEWDPILALLSRQELPIPAFLQNLYRGRALKMSGNDEEGALLLRQALAEAKASDRPEVLPQTAAYFGLAGEDALLDQCVLEILNRPDIAEDALRTTIAALQRRRDANALLRIYELALANPRFADNLTLLNDRDYLRIILDIETDKGEIALRSSANPRDFAFRITAALALLKSGKAAEALQLLDDCEPDVHVATLPPYQKAVVASALASNSRQREALAVASSVPPGFLSSQEADFLRSQLAKVLPARRSNSN